MPPVRLPLKIIKDAIQDADGTATLRHPRMRLLRTAFLPLNVYICIDIPLHETELVPRIPTSP